MPLDIIISLLFFILLVGYIVYSSLRFRFVEKRCPSCQKLSLKVVMSGHWDGYGKAGRLTGGVYLLAECLNCHHKFKKCEDDWKSIDEEEWEERLKGLHFLKSSFSGGRKPRK